MLNASKRRITLIAALNCVIISIPIFLFLIFPGESGYNNNSNVSNYDYQNFNPFLSFLARIEVAIDAHEKLFIVLSTVAIAWFTGTLYRATSGLLRAAEQQRTDMSESLRIARNTADATMLQTRAAVASQVPMVAWTDFKLVEFDEHGNEIVSKVPPGDIPFNCRAVFCFQNTGPTRIVVQHYSIKWEISQTLAEEPYFGVMMADSRILKVEQSHCLTTNELIWPNEYQAKGLKDGNLTLWAYAFVAYTDFLEEGHQIGAVAKWDIHRGFVGVVRENYSYQRHEKNYAKQSSS